MVRLCFGVCLEVTRQLIKDGCICAESEHPADPVEDVLSALPAIWPRVASGFFHQLVVVLVHGVIGLTVDQIIQFRYRLRFKNSPRAFPHVPTETNQHLFVCEALAHFLGQGFEDT